MNRSGSASSLELYQNLHISHREHRAHRDKASLNVLCVLCVLCGYAVTLLLTRIYQQVAILTENVGKVSEKGPTFGRRPTLK